MMVWQHIHWFIVLVFALMSSTGSPSPQGNGPRWWRADFRAWSLEKSRNIHEQWSDRLWQTATCITWWIITILYVIGYCKVFLIVSVKVYCSLFPVLYFNFSHGIYVTPWRVLTMFVYNQFALSEHEKLYKIVGIAGLLQGWIIVEVIPVIFYMHILLKNSECMIWTTFGVCRTSLLHCGCVAL